MTGAASEHQLSATRRGHKHDHAEAESFLQRFAAVSAARRSHVAADAPIDQLYRAACGHLDPYVRRSCLEFLDHYANEASTWVFAQALLDPVEFVRDTALHAIACETCRSDDLCVTDVVPLVVDVLAADTSPELRHKAIPVLLRLADRDPRARHAVECAARGDDDALVRDVARRALAGQHLRSRRSYQRRARRIRVRPSDVARR